MNVESDLVDRQTLERDPSNETSVPSDPFFSRSILWALKQLCIKFKQSAARMLHVKK
jgi:hypothetical protein